MNYNKKYAEIFCAHFKNNECVKSYVDTLIPRLDDLKYLDEDKPHFTVKSIDMLLDKINNVYSLYYNTKGGSPSNTGQNQDEDICIICYEQFINDNRIIIHPVNCMHRMHSVCARRWWRTQQGYRNEPRCPMCNMASDLPNETPQEIQEQQLLANQPVDPDEPAQQMSRMQRFLLNPRNQNIGRYLLVAGSYIVYRWDVFFNPDFVGRIEFFNGSPMFLLFIFILLGATYL